MKYGFIGCGSMGGAIAKALSTKTKDIQIADRSGKGKALAQELGVPVLSEAQYQVLVDEAPGDKGAILALLGRGPAADQT